MARSEIFLLLPVYKEVEGQPDYLKRLREATMTDLKEYGHRIESVIEFFEIENYRGYYDVENVKGFLSAFEGNKAYYPNPIMRFHYIINKWGEDWREDKRQTDEETYMRYGVRIKDDTLCEMTKRKSSDIDGDTFLFVDCDAVAGSIGVEKIVFYRETIEIEKRRLEIIEIARWFEHNCRPQRSFNLNPKHGEFGKGAHPSHDGEKVSVLEGSSAEAQALLHRAVGEDLRKLYFFDSSCMKYIEFRCERENVYHAFHLNKEDECRVPEIIKKRISMLIGSD